MKVWEINISMKLAYATFLYCNALCYFAYAVEWCAMCAESKACNAPLSPLPSPPRPDGVSLGPLMNIDMRGLG